MYFDGTTGGTIEGVAGASVNLKNTSLKNSSSEYIVNAQTKDVLATSTLFGDLTKTGTQLTSGEQYTLNGKIFDKNDLGAFGRVVYDDVAPVVSSVNLEDGSSLEGASVKGVQKVTANVTDNAIPTNAPSFTNFELHKDGVWKAQWAGQGGSVTPYATIDTNTFAEGAYVLRVYGRDQAGNNFEKLVNFRIDRSGPTASSITSPTGWTQGASTITWSTSTDLSGPVTYTLMRSATSNVANDGVALVSDTTSTSFDYALPMGPQWLQVIAKDSAGNITTGPVQGVQVIGTPKGYFTNIRKNP